MKWTAPVMFIILLSAGTALGDYYTITAGMAGRFRVIDGEVYIVKGNQPQDDLWAIERGDHGRFSISIEYAGKRLYLTANDTGKIFLTQVPQKGSQWGLQLPDLGKGQTRIGNRIEARQLDFSLDDKKNLRDSKGTEHEVIEPKLGLAPKGSYDKLYPIYSLTVIAP